MAPSEDDASSRPGEGTFLRQAGDGRAGQYELERLVNFEHGQIRVLLLAVVAGVHQNGTDPTILTGLHLGFGFGDVHAADASEKLGAIPVRLNVQTATRHLSGETNRGERGAHGHTFSAETPNRVSLHIDMRKTKMAMRCFRLNYMR